jgi:hypothetical protein
VTASSVQTETFVHSHLVFIIDDRTQTFLLRDLLERKYSKKKRTAKARELLLNFPLGKLYGGGESKRSYLLSLLAAEEKEGPERRGCRPQPPPTPPPPPPTPRTPQPPPSQSSSDCIHAFAL